MTPVLRFLSLFMQIIHNVLTGLLSLIMLYIKLFSKMILTLLTLPSVLVAITSAQTPIHVPLATSTVQELGFVSDPASNTKGVFHDGGGGASQNGYHVQVFADSSTTSDGFNFVHNSVAYFGFVGCPFLHFSPSEVRFRIDYIQAQCKQPFGRIHFWHVWSHRQGIIQRQRSPWYVHGDMIFPAWDCPRRASPVGIFLFQTL